MNLLTSLVALEITHPSLQKSNYDLLIQWLQPSFRYGHNYPITYQLSRAIHDYYYDGTYLGTYRYTNALHARYLTHLTADEQKELTSWIYASNIFHTPGS